MRTQRLFAIAAAVFFVATSLSAQNPPPTVPPAMPPGTTMLATKKFLFVVHGDALYQFDVATLALRNTFAFPGGKQAAGAPAPVPEILVLEEPPPPPPSGVPLPSDANTAIAWSLEWLAKHQDEDGKWDCDGFSKHDAPTGAACDGPGKPTHDVGVTGLALLAFLGNGNTMRSGPYKDSIKRGVNWLRTEQGADGLFGQPTSHDFIYDHAIAAYAICECFGLSGYETLRPCAQKGLDYLEKHRNPYSVWRYQPRDNDNDTSVTTWAVMALESGKFFGLTVNPQALSLAAIWYDQVTSPDGRAGYTKQGEPSSRMAGDHSTRFPPENGETMTAAATFARFFLGQSPQQHPILKASADRLASKPPKWEPGHQDAVYWYFGTYAMLQMGGLHWKRWSDALDVLPSHQRRDGNAAGSWDPIGVWDESGGRVYVTALYTLALEANARVARLVK